jgi:hypothetical protein
MTKGKLEMRPSMEEVIETLATIAELDPEAAMLPEMHREKIADLNLSQATLHWLQNKNSEKVMRCVRETFATLLAHLEGYYKKRYGHLGSEERAQAEDIRRIMVLVGEAADRLDLFSKLFFGEEAKSVKETREFQKLLSFYSKKVAPIVAEEGLVRKISMLPAKAVIAESHRMKGIFAKAPLIIDLDTIKKDDAYELFFIRKEDGTHFYNPKMLRGVKLTSHLDSYLGGKERESTYHEYKRWHDIQTRSIAQSLLAANWREVDDFAREMKHMRDMPLAEGLYKAICSLMLAAQDPQEYQLLIGKGSSAYFSDFQKFLRQITSSPDYGRTLAYMKVNPTPANERILALLDSFISRLYLGHNMSKNLVPWLESHIADGRRRLEEVEMHLETGPLSYELAIDYEALLNSTANLTYMPLIRVMSSLGDLDVSGFDPWLLENIPSSFFEMEVGDEKVTVLKMASPVTQDYIQKAAVTEEFKAFLRYLGTRKPSKQLLFFNLQDRTSWREFARCHALEELAHHEEFQKSFVVVSMTKSSDFYNQIGPYEAVHKTALFMDQLLDQAQSDNAGFFYPEKVRKVLFPDFAKNLAHAIGELFFSGKNVLSQQDRMDFVEIFTLFMELKIIEIVRPDYVSFSCKDSLDIGVPNEIELYMLLKRLNERPIAAAEEEEMKLFLFASPLLNRGRNILSDRFTRMNNVIRVVEAAEGENAQFRSQLKELLFPLFKTSILHAVLKMGRA